jgi:Zn-dependent peptidase ImmA (M78 family)
VIDIEKIAAELNCSIEIVDFNPGDISARVIRDPSDKSRYRIQISSKEGPLNKRFLIAHEISHIIIHDDGKDQFVELSQPLINYATEDLMYKEVQANILATAILLPKEQVMKAWKACRSIDQVAEIFNVSKAATSLRLDGLGLLEGE